jgi:hypothetical protein
MNSTAKPSLFVKKSQELSIFATKSCAEIELRMGRGVVCLGSSVIASARDECNALCREAKNWKTNIFEELPRFCGFQYRLSKTECFPDPSMRRQRRGHNRGGEPAMTTLMAVYLFDHLEYWYNPRENKTEQSWTLSPVPANRLADKPVYVLTSARTFSGAEQVLLPPEDSRNEDDQSLFKDPLGGDGRRARCQGEGRGCAGNGKETGGSKL